MIHTGERVLDIGCGTGTLALLAAQRGAVVTGIDASAEMLAEAEEKVDQAGLAKQVTLLRMDAGQLVDRFEPGSFDLIIASLVFSEMYPEQRRYVLEACKRLLAPGSRLLIVEEVLPAGKPGASALFPDPAAIGAHNVAADAHDDLSPAGPVAGVGNGRINSTNSRLSTGRQFAAPAGDADRRNGVCPAVARAGATAPPAHLTHAAGGPMAAVFPHHSPISQSATWALCRGRARTRLAGACDWQFQPDGAAGGA